MIRVSNFDGKAAYERRKPKKKGDEGDVIKKVGKIHLTVFAPGGRRVVGFLVKRPDIALMVARPDVFVAYDRLVPYDKGYLIEGEDATDDAARKRLRLDWDRCIAWNGMDAMTEGGKKIGYIGDVEFDERTGKVIAFEIGDGGAATKLVGAVVIPVDLAVGYDRGFLKVREEAGDIQPSGGFAASAGEATAKVRYNAKKNAHETGVMVDAAWQKGARAVGKAVGKAQRAVAEANAEDEEAAAPAKPSSGARKAGGAGSKGAGSSKAKASSASSSARPSSSGKPTSQQVARAAGRQLGKFGSMFKDFKSEFDEASK